MFNPSFFSAPVSFFNTDLAVLGNKLEIINYVTNRVEKMLQYVADSIWNALYSANSISNDKIILGLKDLIDDGATVPTFGWLSRLDYIETWVVRIWSGSMLGWNVDRAGWTITQARLEAMYRACSSGLYKPTLIVTTKELRYAIAKLSTNNNTQMVSYAGSTANTQMSSMTGPALLAEAGTPTDVYFKGIPVYEDEKCTTWEIFFLNLDTFDMYVIDSLPDSTPIMVASSTIEWQVDKNMEVSTWFHRSLEITPLNQYAKVSHLYFSGQLVCTNPKYNGYFTWITG